MALSNTQIQRVLRLAHDDWDREEEIDEFFGSLADSEELHLYASEFNWDCGPAELWDVICHPLCDRGTAFLIYWRAHPTFYAVYTSREQVPEHEREVYDFLREIENRTGDGNYSSKRFPYDPRNDGGRDHTRPSWRLKRISADLPEMMYERVTIVGFE